jgi:hypothetical protein
MCRRIIAQTNILLFCTASEVWMAKQEEAIRHLERNVIGTRYLLEVYKIAYELTSQTITNNKALANLLANTYLRSLILALCAIYSQSKDRSTTQNLSLEKSLKNTFVTSMNKRPELQKLIDESTAILKNQNLDKIRNKKIAHLDMQEVTTTKSNNDPQTYEKLVANAETIIAKIIEANNMKPEREPPKPDTDPALQQLSKILI